MDNTLIHSNNVHIEAFNLAFEKHNLKRIPKNKIKNELDGRPAEKIVKKLYPKLKKDEIKKIVKDHDALVVKKTSKLAIEIPGANQALKEIKKKYTIAVISNCKQKEIKPSLKGGKVNTKSISKVIGHDKVKHSKPFPDMIFKAEKLTHHKAVCMVGDSPYDIKAGKKAKIKTIALTTGIHTRKELMKYKPTLIVKDITKVPAALEKIFLTKKKV